MALIIGIPADDEKHFVYTIRFDNGKMLEYLGKRNICDLEVGKKYLKHPAAEGFLISE